MNEVFFSSERQDWETPQAFFDAVNAEFGFTLDACALPHNAKCKRFISPEEDALKPGAWSGSVWCNPPYGYGIGDWVARGYFSAQGGHADVVVMLIPAKTETRWWHDYVMRAAEIRLIKGRMMFITGDPSAKQKGHNAPFPSALVVFKPGRHTPVFSAMDRFK